MIGRVLVVLGWVGCSSGPAVPVSPACPPGSGVVDAGVETWCERSGIRHGPWERRDDAGTLIVEEGAYNLGRRMGEWVTYWPSGLKASVTQYSISDRAVSGWSWSPSGVLLEHSQMRGGQLDGWQRRWSVGGKQRVEEHFMAGQRDGPERRWREDGSLEAEIEWQAGQRHGWDRQWDAAGMLRAEGRWSFGSPVGHHQTWYPDGQLETQRSYDEWGRPEGLHAEYAVGEQPLLEEEWRAGSMRTRRLLGSAGRLVSEVRLDGVEADYSATGRVTRECVPERLEPWRETCTNFDEQGVPRRVQHYVRAHPDADRELVTSE